MAVSDNSYGTALQVAELVPRYANKTRQFDDSTTRPSLEYVEQLIDQVSAILNSALAQYGFVVPVTQSDVLLALTLFVTEEVASIVTGINGSGKFGPKSKTAGVSRFSVVMEDAMEFIEMNQQGFQNLGAEVLPADTSEQGDFASSAVQRIDSFNVNSVTTDYYYSEDLYG